MKDCSVCVRLCPAMWLQNSAKHRAGSRAVDGFRGSKTEEVSVDKVFGGIV